MKRLLVVLAVLSASGLAQARGLPRNLSYNELVQYLKDGGIDARAEACKRLGERKSTDPIAALGAVIETDSSPKVRESCLKALEDIGSPQGARYVRHAILKDESREVRITAINILEDVERDGGAVLAQVILNDRDNEVRKRALWEVEDNKWASAAPAIVKVLKTETNYDLRRAALKAARTLGTEDVLQGVYDVLVNDNNPDLRREASEVLERNPRRSALPALCKALSDREKRVAKNSAKALESLGLREGARCLREASRNVSDDGLAADMNKIANKLER